MLDVSSVSEFLHIWFFFLLRFLLSALMSMMVDKFLEFLDPNFVQFKLFLFFLQNQQFFLFLYSFLGKFSLNRLNFLIPTLLSFLSLFFQLTDLIIKLLNHLVSDRTRWDWLWFFGFFFVFFYLLLHLLYFWLLGNVYLVIFSKGSFVLKEFFG